MEEEGITLTKADIADHLASDLGLKKLVAKDIVDAVFEVIRLTLESGQSVKISAFGNFELRNKKTRPGRNPKTGESKLIAARRVVTFKAGQKLKKRVQLYKDDQKSSD